MKKIYLIVALLAFAGLMLMVACGGGGGSSGDGLPRSEAVYEGASDPAVIDSTTGTNYWDLPNYVANEVFFFDMYISPAAAALAYTDSYANAYTYDGDISGYYVTENVGESYASTTLEWRWESYGQTYTDYYNSTGTLHGEGNWYEYLYNKRTTDGVIPLAEGAVGTTLTEEYKCHCNQNAYMESASSWATLSGGWMTQNGNAYYDTVGEMATWTQTARADYAENDLFTGYSWGVFDATSNMSYDGSGTAFTFTGTLCDEQGEGPVDGCMDVDMDLTFDCDWVWNCPPNGTMEITTAAASAMYAYDDTGFNYSLDIGDDGSVEFNGRYGYP